MYVHRIGSHRLTASAWGTASGRNPPRLACRRCVPRMPIAAPCMPPPHAALMHAIKACRRGRHSPGTVFVQIGTTTSASQTTRPP